MNFTQSKRFVLSLHYNGSNRFLFVNATKIYQFKVKYLEKKTYPLSLGNFRRFFSKNISINNMKKTGLKGSVKGFSVDCKTVDNNDILDIHTYLMKET